MKRRLRLPSSGKLRDGVLFIAGLAGLGYETFSTGPEKPTLIIAFVGMLGLPLFIRTDEARIEPPPRKATSPVKPEPDAEETE